MDEHARRRRFAVRERGLRRVRSLTIAAGVGMSAMATLFAVSFAGSASADDAPAADPAATSAPSDPGFVGAGGGTPAVVPAPAPIATGGAPRAPGAAPHTALTPPSTTPTRPRPTASRHRSSSSSSVHARTAGS